MTHSPMLRALARAAAFAGAGVLAIVFVGCQPVVVSKNVKAADGKTTAGADKAADKTADKADDKVADKGAKPASAGSDEVQVQSCDGVKTATVAKDATGQPLADALMDQWQRHHPDRDWVAEQKERHNFLPPADNRDVLQTGPGQGHAYGSFTEKDLVIWTRETEKFVAEGSRIFHSGDELGSTVAVSCDMCHPHASNTHPETYPKYQVQLGRVALLRDMINWCVQNPVRAEPLAPDGPKMRALEAYIHAQRKGVKFNYGKH